MKAAFSAKVPTSSIVSSSVVFPLFKKPVRKVGQPVPLDDGRIIALRKADPPRSYKWIAEDMGVSEATIFNRCKKLTEEGRL